MDPTLKIVRENSAYPPLSDCANCTSLIADKLQLCTKSRLNFIQLIFVKIALFFLRSSSETHQSLQNKLTLHEFSIITSRYCNKFLNKKDYFPSLSELQFQSIRALFQSETPQKKDLEQLYESLKYLRLIGQTKRFKQTVNKHPETAATAFKHLPKQLKNDLTKIICAEYGLQESHRNVENTLSKTLSNQEFKKTITRVKNILNVLGDYYQIIESHYADILHLKELQKRSPQSLHDIKLIDSLSIPSQIAIQKMIAQDKRSTADWILEIEEEIAILKSKLNSIQKIQSDTVIYDTSPYPSSIDLQRQDNSLTIAMVSVEYSKLVKQGGLAEAVEGLAQGLLKTNPHHQIKLIFPKYNILPENITCRLHRPTQQFSTNIGEPISVYTAIVDGVECYFIEDPSFNLDDISPSIYKGKEKERFAAFSSLAADLLYQMENIDVIHLHDWHVAGIILKLSKEHPKEWINGQIPPTVFTFHNNNRSTQGRHLAGIYNYDPVIAAFEKARITDQNSNIFIETLNVADAITTVSKTFARESQYPDLGEGVSFAVRAAAKIGKLTGIVNGVNTAHWNPETDRHLKNWNDPATGEKIDLSFGPNSDSIYKQKSKCKEQLNSWLATFDSSCSKGVKKFKFDPSAPMILYIGRFDSYQKGLDKLNVAIRSTLNNGGQFVLMGSQEDSEATKLLDALERKYSPDVLFLRDHKDRNGQFFYQDGDCKKGRAGIGSVVRAAADFTYIPSRYEPCGLVQFEGWLFGAQAIGSNTGGIADTVIPREKSRDGFNGYLFDRSAQSAKGAYQTVRRALNDWHNMDRHSKDQMYRRLIASGRKYSWSDAPQGSSPAEKYQIVYHKAIHSTFKTKARATPRSVATFDIRPILNWSLKDREIDKSQETKEEKYLKEFYSNKLNSRTLHDLYDPIDSRLKPQLPTPYALGIDSQNYNRYGAKITSKSTRFRLLAPQASSVNLRLFCKDEIFLNEIPLIQKTNGDWEVSVDDCPPETKYQYVVNGAVKIDPYALSHSIALDPHAKPYSVVCARDSFDWSDANWLEKRANEAGQPKPMSIYEMHPTAWKRNPDGSPLNYKTLAKELAVYCKKSNFTHVQLMAILEHPCETSMGYQVTGFFALNHRLGSLDDFKYFVDHLHGNGISIILDWIPAHFATDQYGLVNFDSSGGLYESGKWSSIFSKRHFYGWGTKFFDFSKKEVRNFLLSSAMYWINELHIDGLRVDAVRNILDCEYGTAAQLFLKELNTTVHKKNMGIITIAEDYSNTATTTLSPIHNGLGFDYKIHIGWLQALVSYFIKPISRRNNKVLIESIEGDIAHRMVLAISHDEVKGGLRTVRDQLQTGNPDSSKANERSFFSFMFSCPGKKLNFMGNETGAQQEWTSYLGSSKGLMNLDKPDSKLLNLFNALNALYINHKPLWENDDNGKDVEWITKSPLLAYRRKSSDHESLAIFHNFNSKKAIEFEVQLSEVAPTQPSELLFNSESEQFGGAEGLTFESLINNGVHSGYKIKIPPLCTAIIKE
jgi:1,4-alpha-glucan branching enzyme